MKKQDIGYMYLIAASIFGGLVGVIVKLTNGINAYNIVFLRSIIALIFISIILLFKNKFNLLKPYKIGNTILMGIFQGLSILFYFLAIERTNIANAIFLVYSAPVFSLILSSIFLKEKIEKNSIFGVFIAMIGILLIANPSQFSFTSENTIGNIYGLLGGFFYAAMAVSAKPLMKHVTNYYTTFWQYVVMILMFLPFYNTNLATIIFNWWQLGIIGILCTGVAYLFFMNGVKHTKGQHIFIITSLEPFLGSLFAFSFLNEIPSALTIIGGIVIL